MVTILFSRTSNVCCVVVALPCLFFAPITIHPAPQQKKHRFLPSFIPSFIPSHPPPHPNTPRANRTRPHAQPTNRRIARFFPSLPQPNPTPLPRHAYSIKRHESKIKKIKIRIRVHFIHSCAFSSSCTCPSTGGERPRPTLWPPLPLPPCLFVVMGSVCVRGGKAGERRRRRMGLVL